MGNLEVRKLFFARDIVETPYNALDEIPLMSTKKNIQFPFRGQTQPQTLIVHVHDELPKSIPRDTPDRKVVLLVDASSPLKFSQVESKLAGEGHSVYPQVALNGELAHPLVKFLKRRCEKFYDATMVGARQINNKPGGFIFRRSQPNKVDYIQVEDFQKLSQL